MNENEVVEGPIFVSKREIFLGEEEAYVATHRKTGYYAYGENDFSAMRNLKQSLILGLKEYEGVLENAKRQLEIIQAGLADFPENL